MRALLPVLAALLLAGCASEPKLDDGAARTVCLEMAQGGTYWTAVETAKKEGITDPDQQKTVISAAVRDHCPQYLHVVTW